MKKVLSLVLAVVLVLGMSAVAFGANTDKNKLDAGTLFLGESGKRSDEYRPEDKIILDITKGEGGTAVTRAEVRATKLDVQLRATEGSAIVDSYKIKYGPVPKNGTNQEAPAYIEIKLAKEWVSTKEQDFTLLVYLTADKTRYKSTEQTIYGTFANELQEVGEFDDYVYLADVPVVEATDYVRDIEVALGQGVSIHTKLFDGKKYYGKVSQDVKAEDEAILAQYPDIETVYYLQTIGLASTGETVAFDLSTNYYAYTQDEDGNLVYIGRTNDKLAYYTKYFLSTKELDVDVVQDGGDGEILVPGETEEPPVMGGDGEAPANVNDNPSTGR